MTDALTAADVALIRSGRWFSGLAPDVAEALLAMLVPLRLRAGQPLFGRGQPNDGVYVVLGGSLCVGRVSSSGREAILGLAAAPQWLGEVSLLDGGVRTHDAWADDEVRAARAPLPALRELLARRPEVWLDIGRLTVHKLRLAFEMLEGIALDEPRTRLVRHLAALADGYGERRDGGRRRVRISQERFASVLNMSRQTVNELLGELEREGLVKRLRGAVEIVDGAWLAEARDVPEAGLPPAPRTTR